MTRNVLNNRRSHQRLSFSFWNINFQVGIGRDVKLGLVLDPVQEIFIDAGKSGTEMQTMSRDAAVLMSIALQHGAPIETMRHAVTRNVDGSPQGPIGALLDLLAEDEVQELNAEAAK